MNLLRMLFGVVYDKFSMRSCALTFATCATLRRAGADLQGHCVPWMKGWIHFWGGWKIVVLNSCV